MCVLNEPVCSYTARFWCIHGSKHATWTVCILHIWQMQSSTQSRYTDGLYTSKPLVKLARSLESLILADFAEEWRECRKNKAGWLKRVRERKWQLTSKKGRRERWWHGSWKNKRATCHSPSLHFFSLLFLLLFFCNGVDGERFHAYTPKDTQQGFPSALELQHFFPSIHPSIHSSPPPYFLPCQHSFKPIPLKLYHESPRCMPSLNNPHLCCLVGQNDPP